MAFSVISQRFYKDNELQFMHCEDDATSFDIAYAHLRDYVESVAGAGQTIHIQTLNVTTVQPFIETQPLTENVSNMRKAGYLMTVTFKRREEQT